jgi:ABC-type branched-subunit amino acid transport system ATPase component
VGLSIDDKIYVLENGRIAFEASSTDLSGVEYAKKIYLGGLSELPYPALEHQDDRE